MYFVLYGFRFFFSIFFVLVFLLGLLKQLLKIRKRVFFPIEKESNVDSECFG